jgi:hypothetical protein
MNFNGFQKYLITKKIFTESQLSLGGRWAVEFLQFCHGDCTICGTEKAVQNSS